jgi:hypothetical protein
MSLQSTLSALTYDKMMKQAPKLILSMLILLSRGIIKATNELSLDIPLIVRLQGTKEKEAKKLVLSCWFSFGCLESWTKRLALTA